jgi:Fur family ferric uptake transcriptional regulator
MSPEEILRSAQRAVPGIGLATVYRHIRQMVVRGELRAVSLPGAPDRYEPAGMEHHHHFLCRRCDRLYDVEECPGSFDELAPSGFHADAHDLVLYGTCAGCNETRGRAR